MQTTRLGEVVQLVRSGRKIEAIKLFRETFHVGLKEAKDIVEQMERNETVQLGMTAMQGYGSSSSFSAGSTFNPVLTDSLGQPVVQGGDHPMAVLSVASFSSSSLSPLWQWSCLSSLAVGRPGSA